MSCDHTRAVLTGESPWLDPTPHLSGCTDCSAFDADLRAIDDAFMALPVPEVPADLVAATRAAMAAEVVVVPLRRRRWAWGGLAAAAAAVLVIGLPPAQPPADPATLIEKGLGETQPEISLQVAVQSGESTARMRLGHSYDPGDVLYFRSSTDRSAEVLLLRLDAANTTRLHHEPVGPGAMDLPLSWTLESGEGDAVFALLAAEGTIDVHGVEDVLSDSWPDDPCQSLAETGLSCASVFVGISPFVDAPTEEVP